MRSLAGTNTPKAKDGSHNEDGNAQYAAGQIPLSETNMKTGRSGTGLDQAGDARLPEDERGAYTEVGLTNESCVEITARPWVIGSHVVALLLNLVVR